jgi:hypothetical protein
VESKNTRRSADEFICSTVRQIQSREFFRKTADVKTLSLGRGLGEGGHSINFTPALILTFSPGEKEQPSLASCGGAESKNTRRSADEKKDGW